MMLLLGLTQTVQFWHNKLKVIMNVRPKSGDLYYVPLKINNYFQHCVCAADKQDSNEEGGLKWLSFVFFYKCPKYASENKILTGNKMKGYFETLLAG